MLDEELTRPGIGAYPPFPADLRRRLPQRDPLAVAAFFEHFFDRVYGYIRRLVRDEHLAEDLTQDVFLHIQRAFDTYDAERELRPWVFTIATNKVRDHWRSRRHHDAQREASVERDGGVDDLRAATRGPGEALASDELGAHLRAAIDELPESMRTTVMLRLHEGLSFEAIGGIVDRSEVAVRKRYSRALETLRDTLGEAWRTHSEGT